MTSQSQATSPPTHFPLITCYVLLACHADGDSNVMKPSPSPIPLVLPLMPLYTTSHVLLTRDAGCDNHVTKEGPSVTPIYVSIRPLVPHIPCVTDA